MQVSNDLSLFAPDRDANVPVQLIMLLLLGISIMSWTYISSASATPSSGPTSRRAAEDDFWSGGDLSMLQQAVANRRAEQGACPHLRCRHDGVPEGAPRRRHTMPTRSWTAPAAPCGLPTSAKWTPWRRHLNFLASAGLAGPYIGLLGTVRGIMHAFIGLSNMQQATLASVAPGIAEALIATAIGLFAAIPAVVAYNRFTNDIDRLSIRFDSFVDEFLNILQRQVR